MIKKNLIYINILLVISLASFSNLKANEVAGFTLESIRHNYDLLGKAYRLQSFMSDRGLQNLNKERLIELEAEELQRRQEVAIKAGQMTQTFLENLKESINERLEAIKDNDDDINEFIIGDELVKEINEAIENFLETNQSLENIENEDFQIENRERYFYVIEPLWEYVKIANEYNRLPQRMNYKSLYFLNPRPKGNYKSIIRDLSEQLINLMRRLYNDKNIFPTNLLTALTNRIENGVENEINNFLPNEDPFLTPIMYSDQLNDVIDFTAFLGGKVLLIREDGDNDTVDARLIYAGLGPDPEDQRRAQSLGRTTTEEGFRVSAGFWDIFLDSWDQVYEALIEHANELGIEMGPSSDKNFHITIVGHSMGGALAAIAAQRLYSLTYCNTLVNQIKVLTIGPPHVFDSTSAYEYNNSPLGDNTLLLTHRNDWAIKMVPRSIGRMPVGKIVELPDPFETLRETNEALYEEERNLRENAREQGKNPSTVSNYNHKYPAYEVALNAATPEDIKERDIWQEGQYFRYIKGVIGESLGAFSSLVYNLAKDFIDAFGEFYNEATNPEVPIEATLGTTCPTEENLVGKLANKKITSEALKTLIDTGTFRGLKVFNVNGVDYQLNLSAQVNVDERGNIRDEESSRDIIKNVYDENHGRLYSVYARVDDVPLQIINENKFLRISLWWKGNFTQRDGKFFDEVLLLKINDIDTEESLGDI